MYIVNWFASWLYNDDSITVMYLFCVRVRTYVCICVCVNMDTYNQLSSNLTIKKFCQTYTSFLFRHAISAYAWLEFSKASAVVISCSQLTSKLTFENFCQAYTSFLLLHAMSAFEHWKVLVASFCRSHTHLFPWPPVRSEFLLSNPHRIRVPINRLDWLSTFTATSRLLKFPGPYSLFWNPALSIFQQCIGPLNFQRLVGSPNSQQFPGSCNFPGLYGSFCVLH